MKKRSVRRGFGYEKKKLCLASREYTHGSARRAKTDLLQMKSLIVSLERP